ncbi:HepT-like ribonuclease domain-containing protein [Belnapia moabensis]|uniref:HepT-like ribonuclease domain-containing protein n=1 Tax=Belnapia moabensis TaxID=365533 RepID=UPI0005BE7C0A|nr:HepT-like ribonuclease domain-containing protein [Belnapia moabensis]
MRDLTVRLADIRTAAADILSLVEELDEQAFAALPETDCRTYRAIKNALAELGEATKQLPPEVLAAQRNIDCRGFAGLCDIVTHQYFSVELSRLWPTVNDEPPALLVAIDVELRRLSSPP